MIDHLLKMRRVTAEHTSFDVILEEVKAMECSTQSFNLYKKERQSCLSHNDTERSGNNGNTDHSTRPCRVVRFLKSPNGVIRQETPIASAMYLAIILVKVDTAIIAVTTGIITPMIIRDLVGLEIPTVDNLNLGIILGTNLSP